MPDIKEKKFYLEADDFGLLLPGLDDLLLLKKHYKDFKITLFTIPFPKEFFYSENQKHFSREKYRKWAEIINSYGDWMEIAVHGFSHTHYEMDTSYEKATTMLTAIENLWDEIGLKYKKIFRAPYWQYSYDALMALKDKGYLVAIDRNYPRPVPAGMKKYMYNWSFEERQIPPRVEVVKGHGHVYQTGRVNNAVADCYQNITKIIPAGAKFGFISELTEEEAK